MDDAQQPAGRVGDAAAAERAVPARRRDLQEGHGRSQGRQAVLRAQQGLELGPLPNITTPISWPFLQRPILKKAANATYDVLNLAFVAAPPAGYTVRIYNVTYTSAANAPPQVIGVAFPMDLDISKPPPFLVHFKHIPGQVAGTSLFKYFDPMGYDWLSFEIWGWLNFTAKALPNGSTFVNMPFLSPQQASFGFCYQLRQANKQYVIVLPQISRIFDPATGRLRDYQCTRRRCSATS